MKRRRVLAGLFGAAGLAATLAVDASLPLGRVVDRLGSDYLVVAVVGVGLGLLVLPLLATGRAGNLEQTETPDPERPVTAPPAGRRLDEIRTSLSLSFPVVGRDARTRLRDRLRRAATDTVARSTDCDRETARSRVVSGDWSDDRVATTFLAERTLLAPAAVVGALRHGVSPHGYAAGRVVDELNAVERVGPT